MVTACLVNSMEPTMKDTFLLAHCQNVQDAARETYSDLENSSQTYELKNQILAV